MPSMTKSPADVDKYIYIPELVLAVTEFLITVRFFLNRK